MNIDDLEGLDEETCKEIKELQKVTREKDGDNNFSEAQATIGELLIRKNKIEKAIDAWSQVKRSDNQELYAKLQINIGIAFKELGNIENALQSWRNVTRSDNHEVYANAQFYTGSVLKENKNNKEAIAAWGGIERLDHPDLYARAKLSIGIALLEQQDIEGALMAWRSIKRSDSLEAYASAQINISNRLKLSNDIEGALAVLGKVKREDDLKAFAHAQFNIGAISKERGNDESALEIWSNITRLDNLETYAKAQFNIGVVLHNSNNLEGAVLAWSSIEKSDDRKIYVSAQYSIALILKTKGDFEGALIAFNNVERSDNPKIYAQAQVNVGWILDENKNTIGALEAWNKVQSKDDKEAYALAQYSIAVILSADAGSNKNIDIWQNLAFLEDPDIFIYSQYNLGKSFINNNISKNYIQARKAFENAEIAYPYEANCYKKICDLFKNIENYTIGNLFLEFFEKTMNINEILKIDFDGFSEGEKSPERKLAHYTGTDTTNKLLDIEKGKERPSSFRLNTVNNVNDPSEGQLLLNELRGIRKVSSAAPDFDEKLHAFISCFTFNHDSLNQFRLYGKENNKEASGISLVFNKYFFQEGNYVGGLSYVSFEETLQTIDVVSIQKDIKIEVLPKQNNGVIKRLQKQPVMRCVYLDPTSGYIQLAQRNRLTFFREFADENFEYQDSSGFKREAIWAEVEWERYKFEIEEKTKSFEKAFKELKVIYVKINEEKIKFENTNLKILNDIKTLLNEILLPLKYLIKHSAFQEEQECRMIYITSLKDPKVKMNFGKFLYVEYETDVKTHLNKIYIAPAATQYQPYLAKLLCDTNVKIELSNNPYRQT